MNLIDQNELYEATRTQEMALIGACLRGGRKTFDEVREILGSGDFLCQPMADAWRGMEALATKNMGIDVITVGDELKKSGNMPNFAIGGISERVLLSQIRESGEPRHVLTYAVKVQEASLKRNELEPLATSMVGWCRNGRSVHSIVEDVTSKLSQLEIYGQHEADTVPIKVAVSEAYDWVEAASKGELVGIPTGYIDLDKLLSNMYGGNFHIVAARPGQGKTALLLSIAKNVCEKRKKPVLFSLEMSREQVAMRLMSQVAQIDTQRLFEGKLQEDEWPKFTNAVETVEDWNMSVNDITSISIPYIRAIARKMKAKDEIDLLMVDYIQLADSDIKRRERRELDVSAISRGLKHIARELDIPVIAASQLSRELEKRSNKRPILSDLRESGSLEQDADIVMFIYRPDQYEPDTLKKNTAEIIVAKHRNGPVGSAELIFRPSFARFENAETRNIKFNGG